MDFGYLMSILELYLAKEKNSKTKLNIVRYSFDKVKINFTTNDAKDTTTFFMSYDEFVNNHNLNVLLRKYKGNLIIIDEKYENDKVTNSCYYCVTFSNSRILSFEGFELEFMNGIRNILYNIRYMPSEIKIQMEDEEYDGYYNVFQLSEAGFTGYLTLFLITIWFLDVFVIALWICKNFI